MIAMILNIYWNIIILKFNKIQFNLKIIIIFQFFAQQIKLPIILVFQQIKSFFII